MKNITSIVVAVLSFASSVIAGSAFAGEMYVNNLASDAIVSEGAYDSITVPEGGYKATAFSAQTSVSGGSGSYAGIMKVGGSYYVDTHTVSGWFSVTLPTDSSLKTIYFAQGDVGTNHGKGHTGYRLAVDSNGVLYVGKTGNDEGTTWEGNEYKKTTMGVISNETWCYVTVALDVNVGSEAATPHIFINGESVGMESGTFRINVWGTSCANFFIGAGVSAAGLYIDTEAVTDTSKIIKWATDPYLVESASSTSRPEVETAATKWSDIDNWDPPFKSGKDVMAKLTLLGSDFDFDVEDLMVGSMVIDSASDVVLTASKVPSVARYDLSGCTAKSTLTFDPGDAIVVAGSETKVTVASTMTEYLIGSGKRLYLKDPTVAAGKITQDGLLGYWGTFDINTPINTTAGEGIEYAGTNTLNNTIGNGTQPTYFSGTITVKDGLTFVNGTSSDLRIIGGETLLAGKALLSHGGGGANITVSGGVLKGTSGATNPYIYYGGWSGVINLSVNGTGRWKAAIRPHADWIGRYAVTIDVSEQGVFAPSALAFENNLTATATSGTILQVHDGGTFEMPANVPYWIPEEVTSGTATNVISGNTEMAAPLTVAEGATLVIRGPEDATLSLAKISGTGKVIVEGATLDLSDTVHFAFTGSISTTGDGKLLPEGLGEDDAFVSVTTAEPIPESDWADLPWKGFFGASVNPSVWATGEENASFTGSGRVDILSIADGVLSKGVFIADGVTVAVGGKNVLPGATIANNGTIEYTGTQSFDDARVGISGKVTLAGEHAFTLTASSTGTGFNSRLSGLNFAGGTTVFMNTSTYADTEFAKSFTSASAPLVVTGGTLNLGNLYLYVSQEDKSGGNRWSADLSNGAIVRGGFFCWGYTWWTKCDIVLNNEARLETPMGPMNNDNEAPAAAYMRVTVNDSATFAPAYLRTTDVEPILKDYEPTGKYADDLQVELRPGNDGNDATPTFELPEFVPSWVKVGVYAPGAQLLIPEGRSVAWNASAESKDANSQLSLKGAGTLSPQEKGAFNGTSLRLDGPTVVIGEYPIVCRDFTFVSGAFQVQGRWSSSRVLVQTEEAMPDDIVTELPLIKDRNYVLSDDKLELRSVPKPGFLILFK